MKSLIEATSDFQVGPRPALVWDIACQSRDFSDVCSGDEPTLHAVVVVMEPFVEDRDTVENQQIQ